MQLIKSTEQTEGCGKCRHYYCLKPEERFPHGCLAMKYIGKRPPADIVLNQADGPCPLFTPIERVLP